MNLYLQVYIALGLCTVGACLLGMVRVLQSGTVTMSAPSRLRLAIIVFMSATTYGVCWPLYWAGIGLAKLVELVDDMNDGAAP